MNNYRMALNGPASTGLVREREAALAGIRQLNRDAHLAGENWQLEVLDARLEVLEGYWSRFQKAQRQLLLEFSDVDVIQDQHSEIEGAAMTLFIETKAETARLRKTKLEGMPPPAKIPKVSEIRMSSFSGTYTDWIAWRSEFCAKVKDTALDASEKISILLASLKHEAAACAGRAERLDEEEFLRIWTKLEKTYDNKYQQAYAHIMEILNIPQMTHAAADKLRAMIDTADQHLRMLKRFGIDTDHWSAIVCVILLGKLDRETRCLWETKDQMPSLPDLPALFTHLEQRILAIRNVEQSSRQYRQQPPQTQVNDKLSKPQQSKPHDQSSTSSKIQRPTRQNGDNHMPTPCLMCANGSRHFLWKCDGFRALSIAKKMEQLKRWKICEGCLIASHSIAECSKGMCPNCQLGKHNSLICSNPKIKQAVHHVRGGKRHRNQKSD